MDEACATRRRVLVTGFQSFPGMPINPTEAFIRRLRRSRSTAGGRLELYAAILPVSWTRMPAAINAMMDEHRPEACVFFGVSNRAQALQIETVARNTVTQLVPDADGCFASDRTLASDGPTKRRTALPVRQLKLVAERSGPADLSSDAGRYLCNAAFWLALERGLPCVFVHWPNPPNKLRHWRKGRQRAPDYIQLEAASRDVIAAVGRYIANPRDRFTNSA